MEEGKKIQFKPMNSGLGFHPFSEGLPYTPISKVFPNHNPAQNPTGAIPLAPPKFNWPQPQKTQKQALPQVKMSVIPELSSKHKVSPFSIFYLAKRVLAYVLDMTTHFILGSLGLGIVFWRQNLEPDFLLQPGIFLLLLLFMLVFHWALTTAQEVTFGTSFGKKTFGLFLNGKPGALLWRAVLFIASVSFCGLGLLWAMFRKDKKCWHDVATQLQPLEK